MRLDIEHFAKIKRASIKLDGITVIAGENNTGKSTVGKVLSCMFNSMYRMEDKIQEQRKQQIVSVLEYGLDSFRIRNIQERTRIEIFRMPYRLRKKKYAQVAEEILNSESAEERYLITSELYEENKLDSMIENYQMFVQEIEDKIENVLQVDDKKIENTLIEKTFEQYFFKQINDVYAPESAAVVDLKIQGNSVHMEMIKEGGISVKRSIPILHEAICITSPLIVDYMNSWEYSDMRLNGAELQLIRKLSNTASDDILGEILVSAKLESIFELLDEVTTGKIIKNEEGEFVLVDREKNSFEIQNLSMGVKAFSIIRILLERGMIREKDVLILDEPEIHLHPEWQLVYAEIIVLLEKFFDLTILITTHSPYFLEAIEMYTRKHKITDVTNYYLAEKEGNEAVIKEITGNLQSVYELLASPFEKLESMQYLE